MMSNEIIKKHDFELAKKKILSESARVPGDVTLQQFQVEGDFISWNNHNITGKEANEMLVTPLQKTLISQNERIKGLLKIAHEVYVAFDKLDTEYIAGIVLAVESAEISSNQAKIASDKATQASNQALDASREALEASKKASLAQDDIKKTIQALQQTVNILKDFKTEVINKLATLSSVPSQMLSIKQQVDYFVAKVNEAITQISGNVTSLQEYRKQLSSYAHLADIDSIWMDVEGHKTNLYDLHQKVDNYVVKVNEAITQISGNVTSLQEYKKQLSSYAHLADIDRIWKDVEGHKNELNDLHQTISRLSSDLQDSTEKINKKMEDFKEFQNCQTNRLKKKINIAYGITGISVLFLLVQLVLRLIGIL
ncbi:hypothetical protein [Prevotella koreensis]|uniref:hypothetical protein n=1 Tax=Prevotella koreensis TaxID=2490854 RepID=UPI0028E59617|nr:hypothetical protein [Prevotella koreensis]